MGLERKGSPLLIEKLFCLILQVHVTKNGLLEFKSAIAVTRDSLEELRKKRGPICCRAGNNFVGGYVLFSFLCFTCPFTLLNKYHFVHGFILGLISEE